MSPDETLIESRSYARQYSRHIRASVSSLPPELDPERCFPCRANRAAPLGSPDRAARGLGRAVCAGRSKRAFMLRRINGIVCGTPCFSRETHSRSRRARRYPVHGASQQPAATVRQKHKVRLSRTGATAGTTVIYEDQVST
ncbi:hypothetical protein KDX15_12050 [Burkholderia cenocepacia]|uniref:hypothetical protein n=1 Tax=Burkholderia cenocepacia TaxID=95486 RepID=UPI001B98FCFE|nr:hypothetical protein [Burkholderia cenocepacia]MBR8274575.1 hypothetical protein [Burkholderia cenocepacia]